MEVKFRWLTLGLEAVVVSANLFWKERASCTRFLGEGQVPTVIPDIMVRVEIPAPLTEIEFRPSNP